MGDNVSGLSMNEYYPPFCELAASDTNAFSTFRINPAYTPILEHVTEAQGAQYFSLVEELVKDNYLEIIKNDQFGSPVVWAYTGIGPISPTTLRYCKVLADIKKLVGAEEVDSVCEIGVGYGGQCRLLDSFMTVHEYELVDLPQVLKLANRYLKGFTLKTQIVLSDMEHLVARDRNLVVSNYAFSELCRDLQSVYLEKVILRAKKGYLTVNCVNPPEFNSYSVQELLQLIPGSVQSPEEPLTHPHNCIISWT